jgi:hypothetical protein
MPGLSFEKGKSGKPIAIVKGGDLDGEVLYLQDDGFVPSTKKKRIEIPAHKYAAALKKFKKADVPKVLDRLAAALNGEKDLSPDEDADVKALLDRIKEDNTTLTEMDLPSDSMFQLIANPSKTHRDVFYIAGASGSGKSHIARQIAESYRFFHPDREVYLVSKLAEDSTLDNMRGGKPKRINVQTLVDDPPDIEEFRNCMVIIDDIDALEKPQWKAVMTLANDIAITGRHTTTSLLYLSHHLTNYSATRLLLNEATCYVVYPQTTSKHALKYLLETHAGLDADMIKRLRSLGRWTAIHKNVPPYLISSNYASLCNQD